jgi:hypothetical protein
MDGRAVWIEEWEWNMPVRDEEMPPHLLSERIILVLSAGIVLVESLLEFLGGDPNFFSDSSTRIEPRAQSARKEKERKRGEKERISSVNNSLSLSRLAQTGSTLAGTHFFINPLPT